MWYSKQCFLEMFMSFYDLYRRPETTYREFLLGILKFYEDNVIQNSTDANGIDDLQEDDIALEKKGKVSEAVERLYNDLEQMVKPEAEEETAAEAPVPDDPSPIAIKSEPARSSRRRRQRQPPRRHVEWEVEEAAKDEPLALTSGEAQQQQPAFLPVFPPAVAAACNGLQQLMELHPAAPPPAHSGPAAASLTALLPGLGARSEEMAAVLSALHHQQQQLEAAAVTNAAASNESTSPTAVSATPVPEENSEPPSAGEEEEEMEDGEEEEEEMEDGEEEEEEEEERTSPPGGAPGGVGDGGLEGGGCNCPLCGYHLASRASLRRHVMRHTGEKPLGCSYCPKKFCTRYDLNRHERLHTGVTPFGCPACGRRFTRKDCYNKHVKLCPRWKLPDGWSASEPS